MREAQQLHGQVMAMCQAEAHRLEEVLEFFTLDVPPSKNAPASNTPTT